MHANEDNKEMQKTVLWVGSGLLLGVVFMLGFYLIYINQDSAASKASTPSTIEEPVPTSTTGGVVPTGPVPVPSLTPCTTALSSLNGQQSQIPVGSMPGQGMPAVSQIPGYSPIQAATGQQGSANIQTINLAPGTSYSESSSGYPIYTGGRAVDSPPAHLPYSSQVVVEESTQQIGRNGLVANPCADPPSVHGVAYSRQKAY